MEFILSVVSEYDWNWGEKMGKNQHVTPKGDKWQVIGPGNERATKRFDTQKEVEVI